MDLTQSCPNIIYYEILSQYIQNKANFEYFNNIYLVNNNIYYNDSNNNKLQDSSILNVNIRDEVNDIQQNNFIDKINEEKLKQEVDTDTPTYTNTDVDIDNNNNNDDNDEDKEQEQEQEQDAWESAINDEKFYINNKIARIFPVLKNFNNFSKIKIDDDSFCYITIREIADTISKIICYHLLEHNINPQKCTILDYTAGVGGNVLSFGKFFKLVYAIELDELRVEYLKNNINVYGYKNINVINGCAIKFNSSKLIETNSNIVFIDPPWGGTGYKNNESLTLSLGTINLEELVIDIVDKFSTNYNQILNLNPKEQYNNYNNKFIILKLPKNYDVEYFYNYIKTRNNYNNYNIVLYLYVLNKMLIIVCELHHKFY